MSFVRLGDNSPVDGVNGRTDALVVWQTAGQASGEGGAWGLPCLLGTNLVFVKQAGEKITKDFSTQHILNRASKVT